MIKDNIDKMQELKVKELGVFELRGLAREIGIPSPTTKKREELISLILEKFKSGFTLESKEKRKGRPFKKLTSIDDLVLTITDDNANKPLTFENIMLFAQDMPAFLVDDSTEDMLEIDAIVRRDREKLIANYKEKWIYFKDDEGSYKKLRQGDKVKVVAQSMGQNQYLANKILKINDIDEKDYSPCDISKRKEILANQVLEIGSINLSVGRRNAMMFNEDIFENKVFSSLVNYCDSNKTKLVVLGVNTSFESQVYLQDFKIENFTTKYGTDNTINFNVVIDAITYVENLIARGEKVIMYVLDIMEIIRLSDRCFTPPDEKITHTSGTMTILLKIMELGQAFQDGNHSTLLLGYNELDKDEQILKNEVLRVSKLVR